MVAVAMMMAMLWQGSAVAMAGSYNPDYAWETDYIPAESPKTMEEILDILNKNPTIFINPVLGKGSGMTEGVDTVTFYMKQRLDYKQTDTSKPNGLLQRVTIIRFVGADQPTVIHTNGYSTDAAGLYLCHLASALGANMIEVEHRYTGYSFPTMDCYEKNGGFLNNKNFWNYNRAEQQSTDIAYVVNTLKKLKIFTGKWVSTGTSKSGMTTTFLAMHHPETCDVYVPFCAPFCQLMDEDLGYWAGKGYGDILKETNEADYQKWLVSWDRVRNFEKNAKLRAEMIKRKNAEMAASYPLYVPNDTASLMLIYRQYVAECFAKASYMHMDDWYDLVPSAVGVNDDVSQAYCDSMYLFLTISYDSLQSHNDKKNQNAASIKRRADMINRYTDMLNTYDMMNRTQQRRAQGEDPATGLDSAIYSLDAYYVQTMYELGNYADDYTMVKDNLMPLLGEDGMKELYDMNLIFNNSQYKPVAEAIGLNTTTPPYKPLDPIGPKVKEFVKSTNAKMVFVYGGNDPWTQAGIKDEDFSQTNIARFVVPNGTHNDIVMSPRYSSDPTIGQKIVDKVKEMLNQTTGIETIQTRTVATPNSDVMYNLSGQKVDNSYKGIVIKNGKKIKQ